MSDAVSTFSVQAVASGKVGITGAIDSKLRLDEARALTFDEITEPVNYNTYATDYFAQVYTRD